MLSNSNKSRSFSAFAASLVVALACCFAVSGCSKPAKKEKQTKEDVVKDLDIKTPEKDESKKSESDDNAANTKKTKATPASHEDEVELLSLDLSDESSEEEEDELPLLDSAG